MRDSCFFSLLQPLPIVQRPETLLTVAHFDSQIDVLNKKSHSRFTRFPAPRLKFETGNPSRSILRAVCSRCLSFLLFARPFNFQPRQRTRNGTFQSHHARTYGEQRELPEIGKNARVAFFNSIGGCRAISQRSKHAVFSLSPPCPRVGRIPSYLLISIDRRT
jgi:hypothetical protein